MQLIHLGDDIHDISWDGDAMATEALEYWNKALVTLFLKQLASPNDIDYRSGRTLPHYLALRYHGALTSYDAQAWQTLGQVGFTKENTICDGLYVNQAFGSVCWS